MRSFYSNLAKEDTKNKKKKRVKNAIVLKKIPKSPILKKRL
jgi:hypothetical protein